jgi:hypothetical protein
VLIILNGYSTLKAFVNEVTVSVTAQEASYLAAKRVTQKEEESRS